MVFDRELLALGVLMNKSHRNYANVCVNDGTVIIVNGDGTFAVRYCDETVKGKRLSFPISEFPDGAVSVFSAGEEVIFKVKKCSASKIIKVKASENYFDVLNELFDKFKGKIPSIVISKDAIDLLDDEISFFTLIYDKGKVKLKQFHGYTGRISLIEAGENQPTIDSFFGEEDDRCFEIGTITDIWKMIYSYFDDLEFYFEPGLAIYGKGLKGKKVVEFLISDARWEEG